MAGTPSSPYTLTSMTATRRDRETTHASTAVSSPPGYER